MKLRCLAVVAWEALAKHGVRSYIIKKEEAKQQDAEYNAGQCSAALRSSGLTRIKRFRELIWDQLSPSS